ncbi:hypothetical protein C3488_16065 [Streptomyces sp. Ru72]|nr:hypothetical protein C3488_16065 [Streptomyces sp. Ru72]
MIVKDEAPVIRRCLESVRSLIDTWVIVDTGSSDGTQDVIREVYSDVPGVLYERSWKGFDGSRTEAIELARSSGDYLLFMDADDVMEVEPGFRMPELTHDGYSIAVHHGPVIHWRPTLAATRLPWRYIGVLHEYLYCDPPLTLGTLQGIHMRIVGAGDAKGTKACRKNTCETRRRFGRLYSRSRRTPVTSSTSPRAGEMPVSTRRHLKPMTGERPWGAGTRRSSARAFMPRGWRGCCSGR